MVQQTIYQPREDGVVLKRTYSDTKHFIRKVGTNEVYVEAIDVESANYTYEETAEIIPEENNEKDN